MRCLALRLCLVAALAGGGPADGSPADAQDAAQWALYRSRFVTDDGRVVDTGNQRVSHTEGQGFALLFAEAFGDRETFDRLWEWTRTHLQRPDSALFAWRWDPADPKNPVADPNNASDGDILIAWALARAGETWREPHYRDEARRIVTDIRARLLSAVARRLVLLPGRDGFVRDDGSAILNPSYYVYPALPAFDRLVPSYEWDRLRQDGLGLLDKARFGKWRLPSDWVSLDPGGAVKPAPDFPPRFGFDAVRVPLYLIWAGLATPELLAAYLDFWGSFGDGPVAAWTDLADNATAPYPASTGVQAIVRLARADHGGEAAPLPEIGDQDDYYAASLALLARLAQHERTR